MQEPYSPKSELKIILVGSSGVGKTCLMSAYFKKFFESESMPTVAPAFNSTTITRQDGQSVTLQIWDTAGQERYHSVSQLFFRDSDVALVCFEANETDFSEAYDWIRSVRAEVPTCNILLVITKSDLIAGNTREEILERVEDEFSNIGAKGIFVTSSAKREGINQLFESCADFYSARLKMTAPKPPKESYVEPEKKCC